MIAAPWLPQAASLTLGATAVLVGSGWVADAPRWADGGPLGWDLHRLRGRRLWRSRAFAMLCAAPGLRALGLAQTGLGGWLVIVALAGAPVPLVALAALAMVLAAQSLREAGNAADKLLSIATVGLALIALGARLNQPLLAFAGVAWVGGQLVLAYATSGLSKLRHARWRDGTAVRAALNSYNYGAPWTARLTRHPARARLLAWAIILPEVAFPFALLLPRAALMIVLAGFLAFHGVIARVMGLNVYPWAFLTAYPATLALGAWLRAALGLG